MHEIGLCESVLQAVERRAAGRQVSEVRVRIGVLHRVVDTAMAQAFALVSQGTVAEGAAVDLVTVPVDVSCRACGRNTEATEPVPVCPVCGAADPQLSGGDELTLESIRIAAPRAASTASAASNASATPTAMGESSPQTGGG